jgi:hypothetical protein
MSLSTATLDAPRGPNGELPLGGGKAGHAAGVTVVQPTAVRTRRMELPSYALRSTVRYRTKGRTVTGSIIGIAHGEPLRYDIRCLDGADGERNAADRVSFGVPQADIERLIAPPPDSQKVIVLGDHPSRPPAPTGQGEPRPVHRSFLAELLGIHVLR